MASGKSGRQLVSEWERKASLERLPFIPFVHAYAAKLAGETAEDMLWDPGKWSQALIAARRLLGYDGIVVNFDPTLEAEALGCEVDWTPESPYISQPMSLDAWLDGASREALAGEGRFPVMLETLKRIQKVEQDAALCVSITGIGDLPRMALGESGFAGLAQDQLPRVFDAAQKTVLATAKLLGECRPSVLFIRERNLGYAEAARIAAWYQPIMNLLKYFRVPAVFLLEEGTTEAYPHISFEQAGGKQAAGFGVPLRYFDAWTAMDEAGRELAAARSSFPQPGLLVTAGEVPWQTDVDRFKDLMDVLI